RGTGGHPGRCRPKDLYAVATTQSGTATAACVMDTERIPRYVAVAASDPSVAARDGRVTRPGRICFLSLRMTAQRTGKYSYHDPSDIDRRPTTYWTISVGEKYVHP